MTAVQRELEHAHRMKVAIVGCGPRGFYALDSLCSVARSAACASGLDVTVFEPAAFPGAGEVYDPSQPDYLVMNFVSDYVDAWDRSVIEPAFGRPSLTDWLAVWYPSLKDPTAFVPRAVVGRYLHDCFQTVFQHSPANVGISLRRDRVNAVTRSRTGWSVQAAGFTGDFDEVLIATGHQDWKRSNQQTAQQDCGISAVFPVTDRINEIEVPSGSAVGVRGFSLTWIDAALALTVGRGGVFTPNGSGYDYERSGREPRSIVPMSRTGRPVLCKPEFAAFPKADASGLWSETSLNIRDGKGHKDKTKFGSEVWPTILQAADIAMGCQAGTTEKWFENWRSTIFDGSQALAYMQRSFDAGSGRAKPDAALALGESWRKNYFAMAERLGHGGLEQADRQQFASISTEMERIAFGPPAASLGKILSLVRAGLIDLRFISSSSNKFGVSAPLDVRVNATIPSPEEFDPAGPLERMVETNLLKLYHGGGIIIDQAGGAQSDDKCVTGLSVLGRSTEGWVIGNDSLSRQLDRHPTNWARKVVARAEGAVTGRPLHVLEPT